MHLIGLHGRARVGKDTVADYLAKQYGFLKSSFAGPLKRAAKEMFGLSDAEMMDGVKEDVIPYWGYSPRQMFQLLGTEGGRMVFGDDLWLKRWKKFVLDFGATSHIVVTDVRFENEAALIRELGGTLIHVTSIRASTLTTTAKAHASEAGVKFLPGDILLDNSSSFPPLYREIDGIMLALGGELKGISK
jgi:hypothetical protein